MVLLKCQFPNLQNFHDLGPDELTTYPEQSPTSVRNQAPTMVAPAQAVHYAVQPKKFESFEKEYPSLHYHLKALRYHQENSRAPD